MSQIDSAKVLYSKGRNDECNTPIYGVLPIIKHLKSFWSIWCPFDTEDSHYVKELRKAGFTVIASHIDNDQDFYKYEPDQHWDCIVSNPPFTNKRLIFERALSFGKPFALLMSNTWLNDSAPKQLFYDVDLQLLMFDKRIHFESGGKVDKKTTFGSSYYCRDILSKQIIMEKLKAGSK
jgi:hypothetical protein